MSELKKKRAIMKRYDATSEIYDERYSLDQQAMYKKALNNINIEGKKILDFGCGSGLFFSQVESQADIVIGVDFSHKLLRKAKERAGVFNNVFISQADGDLLPFKDGLFDSVFVFTVFQNMPNIRQTLIELKRVAKAGGKVVVTSLKKAISLDMFINLLKYPGFELLILLDDETINCYMAVLSA